MKRVKKSGFSLMEVLVAMAIVAIAAAVAIPSLQGLFARERLLRAADQMKTDIVYLKTRSITNIRRHRLKLLTASTYRLEQWSGTAWTTVGATKTLPVNITFRTYDLTNKSVSLEFQTNGLPLFNGANSSPFLTVIEMPSGVDRRGIYIGAGGLVTINDGAADAS